MFKTIQVTYHIGVAASKSCPKILAHHTPCHDHYAIAICTLEPSSTKACSSQNFDGQNEVRTIFPRTTLQGLNISHLGKRKIIFKMPFLGDMLVPWRVRIGYTCPTTQKKMMHLWDVSGKHEEWLSSKHKKNHTVQIPGTVPCALHQKNMRQLHEPRFSTRNNVPKKTVGHWVGSSFTVFGTVFKFAMSNLKQNAKFNGSMCVGSPKTAIPNTLG